MRTLVGGGRKAGGKRGTPREDTTLAPRYASARVGVQWWARQDSNLRPIDYESTALTTELRARLPRTWSLAARRMSSPVPC